jgi:uncharacterized protein YcfJ
MNKSLLIGLAVGAGAATAVAAVANYPRVGSAPDAVQVSGPSNASGTVQRDVLRARIAMPGAEASLAGVHGPSVAPIVEPAAEPAVSARATLAPAATTRSPAPARRTSRSADVPRSAGARVVDVRPITDTVSEPREVCRDEPVVQQVPVRDEHRVAGTLLGAAIGGVLGNQVGGGDGRKIATVVGAMGGGFAGTRVQDRIQRSNTTTTTERRCETVYEPREVTRGYDVTYSYEGRTQTVRMDHAPGDRLPVHDGRVLTASR